MKREELIIQIKKILFDEYVSIAERNRWEFLIPKMTDEDLKELLENLKLKTKALFNVDQTLYKLGKTCEANLNIDKEIDREAEKHPWQDLSEEDLSLLLTQKLSPWLEKDIDLREEIENYLSFEADPELRKKLLDALTTNEEIIGKNNIIKSAGVELKPTISNWLKDYERRIAEKPDRVLARAEYLTNSPNIQKISPAEKEKVKKVIELYEFLKFPISPFFLPGRASLPPAIPVEPSIPVFPPKPPIRSATAKEPKKPEEKISALEKKYLEEEKEK